MSDQSIESFWINIIAGVVMLAVTAALKLGYDRLISGNPARRRSALAGVGLFWAGINAVYVYSFRSTGVLFIFLSFVALSWIIYSELNQFWRIGLVGADRQISSGIDFQRALRLVSSSLVFLGIGASKLTSEGTVFEAAISRCNSPDRPVRFLLCRPDSEGLEKMARSADQDKKSYQKKVLNSLRTIADLRNNRGWNIEVRFYKDLPVFRLMFVDDSLCLASHYVFGKGSGAELPQLHVVRLPGSRDVDSLYYAFSSYFEHFWNDSDVWDFQRYVDPS